MFDLVRVEVGASGTADNLIEGVVIQYSIPDYRFGMFEVFRMDVESGIRVPKFPIAFHHSIPILEYPFERASREDNVTLDGRATSEQIFVLNGAKVIEHCPHCKPFPAGFLLGIRNIALARWHSASRRLP